MLINLRELTNYSYYRKGKVTFYCFFLYDFHMLSEPSWCSQYYMIICVNSLCEVHITFGCKINVHIHAVISEDGQPHHHTMEAHAPSFLWKAIQNTQSPFSTLVFFSLFPKLNILCIRNVHRPELIFSFEK